MPFTKDDIDAVSMTLLVNGDTGFQIYLTRGGLTQRMGFSERLDPDAILLKGGTDVFEPFMGTMPESLLAGEGGFLDAGPGSGPKHEWRFELQGGMNALVYDVTYHAGSASLPDEFADLVVHAERLTHSWYTTLLAEETGRPLPSPAADLAPPAPRGAPAPKGKTAKKGGAPAPAARSTPSKSAPRRGAVRPGGPTLPITRERLGLAVLLDFIAWMIPWQFITWIFGGGGERTGPPGAGIVVFAVVEFLVLQIVRMSPGFWLLGISAPQGNKPVVDSAWPARESKETLAFGIGMCALGVAGLTSWTLYHNGVPYFGLGFPLWLSLPFALVGSAALVLAGVLVLRLDLRGVWVGGGVGVVTLLAAVMAWERWGAFVDAAVAKRSEYEGAPVGEGILGIFLGLVPILVVLVPALLCAGAFLTWKRFERPVGLATKAAPTRS